MTRSSTHWWLFQLICALQPRPEVGAPVVSLAFVLDTKLELGEFPSQWGLLSWERGGNLTRMSGGPVSSGVEVRCPVCLEAPLVS